MSDFQIEAIGNAYATGSMSVADLAAVTGLSRQHINWAITEYRRRAGK